jgi:hypothetical protein
LASEACEETTGCLRGDERQDVATSPPLGGASEYFHGRSSDSAGSYLLAGLPRPYGPVSSWAFVPAYRCGAVPDFHRIPFSSSSRRNLGIGTLYLEATSAHKPTPCGYVASRCCYVAGAAAQILDLQVVDSKWWPETGSNRRRRPFQGRALPLSYLALAWKRASRDSQEQARSATNMNL